MFKEVEKKKAVHTFRGIKCTEVRHSNYWGVRTTLETTTTTKIYSCTFQNHTPRQEIGIHKVMQRALWNFTKLAELEKLFCISFRSGQGEGERHKQWAERERQKAQHTCNWEQGAGSRKTTVFLLPFVKSQPTWDVQSQRVVRVV